MFFNSKKKKRRIISGILLSSLLLVSLGGCSPRGGSSGYEISFADAGWDSAKFHNALAGLIAKEVFSYSYREVPGGTTILHEGIMNGEIDVHMEVWTDNLITYEKDLKEDRFKDLGTNFDDNKQGFYVPSYMLEEDGQAPGLRTVADLKDYSHLFPDDENPNKGRIYGAIPGWEVDEIMYSKYLHYGLDENYIYFRPGSEAALGAALTGAYDRKEPIVAYYWSPTWILGKYDFVLLEDEDFDEASYRDGKTELPSVKVNISVSNEFYRTHPDFVEFLKKYETSSDLTSKALAYMEETGASYDETARWFVLENQDLVKGWLTSDQFDKLLQAIN